MGQTQTLGKTATKVSRSPDGTLTVRYHNTDVVTVYPNGRIVLDAGGWFTPTTKTRMNQASNQLGLGFTVFQKDFRWYVSVDGHVLEWAGDSITIRNGS
jgi:hypothetical protein